ncbi:MAG TPA: DUF1080 domain-containing protein [Gemmataceae bacterium]|nr:DUF1080 domain-containing protein [Gemmataceae bacterium]
MFRVLAVSALAALFCVPLALADTPKPVEPFNGKDLKGWKFKDEKKSKWEWYPGSPLLDEAKPSEFRQGVAKGGDTPSMVNSKSGSCDIYTEAKFGDVLVELEFMIPKGSNSGVYLMGEYEVQILDSFGKEKVGPGDMGGIYNTAAPKVNACKKPGEWQKFVIDFQAPRFEGEKKTANAKFIKVTLNDQVIHENVEMKSQTPGGLTGKEVAAGPLMFQGDHGPVAFRSIKITPRGK